MNVIFANVALPSVANHVIIMLVLLFPVAWIEAVILSRRHFLNYQDSFRLVLSANVRSTLCGLPIGYLLALVGVIPVGIFSSLLPENVGSVIAVILGYAVIHGGTVPSELDTIGFYLGTLLIMVPYFLVTLRVEHRYISGRRPDLDGPRLATTVRLMNDVTYGLFVLAVVIGALTTIAHQVATNIAGIIL